jgi:prolyl-tRNA synthetase
VQVVITPIWKGEAEKAEMLAFAAEVKAALAPRFRVKLDDRDNLKPGAKYFEWERKGVPLRLEIGPRDLKSRSVFAAPRSGGGKFGIPFEGIADAVGAAAGMSGD